MIVKMTTTFADLACPPGCRLDPGHPTDGTETDTGRTVRFHDCHRFGTRVAVTATEYLVQPGAWTYEVYVDGDDTTLSNYLTADQAVQLASDLVAASGWISDQGAEQD